MGNLLFDNIPLWGVFILTVVCVLAGLIIGIVWGHHRRSKPEHEPEASLGTIIGATLGLVAFLMTFTFGIAAERFQVRRDILLNEINAIGTTYLRAGMLPETHIEGVRKLLAEYVDIRLNIFKDPQGRKKLLEYISASEKVQDKIWEHATAVAKVEKTPIVALFIDSLNNMIDLQTTRTTNLLYRIPHIIWIVLFAVIFLSMTMVGYQWGLLGKYNLKIGLVLAPALAMVILLIADLDRPWEGNFQVSQRPMMELQNKIQADIQKYSGTSQIKDANSQK